jgi:hypothetical protein
MVRIESSLSGTDRKDALVTNDIHLADCRDLFDVLAGSGQLILFQ